VSREGKSATTAAFAQQTSPAQARKQLRTAMLKLIADIEETQNKLNSDDLDPLDFTPIHAQLLEGAKAPGSPVDWKEKLSAWVAKDLVADHDFNNVLKELLLETAAAAAFMLAPFTGGASLYVMLAGLAITGVKAYQSAQEYENLAQAAKTSIIPGTEMVTPAQVDEANMRKEADEIALALAVLAVGLSVAGKIIGAFKGPAGKLPPTGTTVSTFEGMAGPLAESRAATLRATMSKGKLPSATSVAVDKVTGKPYFGESGRPFPTSIDPKLATRMPSPSMEKWPVENCAEFKAVNNALLDGAKLENLEIHTVKTRTGAAFPRCQNCSTTLSGTSVTSD
jgi:hypothetical protein